VTDAPAGEGFKLQRPLLTVIGRKGDPGRVDRLERRGTLWPPTAALKVDTRKWSGPIIRRNGVVSDASLQHPPLEPLPSRRSGLLVPVAHRFEVTSSPVEVRRPPFKTPAAPLLPSAWRLHVPSPAPRPSPTTLLPIRLLRRCVGPADSGRSCSSILVTQSVIVAMMHDP
jgi:hypothetical protein